MTLEEKQIAIWLALGWHPTPVGNWTHNPAGIPSGEFPAFCNPPGLEDPLNDLNAMHEAEKTLTITQRIKYTDELMRIWTGRTDRAIPNWMWIHEAAASQRAEAFLRTIHLWKD